VHAPAGFNLSPGVQMGCRRNSQTGIARLTAVASLPKALGYVERQSDACIAVISDKLIEGGLQSERLA
jgi:hypothetical protein